MSEVDPARAEELLTPVERALSRRALLEEAFSLLHGPYGWAGRDGGHDCSRFLLDVFSSFGIELPRHSARQARAGTFFVDVSKLDNNKEKQLLIEAAARRGIVLLQLPGHIMLYLGKTEDGVPMVMHAFSEFLTTCPDGVGEIINRTDEIEISDLSLGSGTSRRDFLSRITRITVIGKGPGPELIGSATLRPPQRPVFPAADRCKDTRSAAIFTSPRRPNRTQPLTAIATASRDPGSAQLALRDPDGNVHQPTVHRLGGPPFTQWVQVPTAESGRWAAVLADGDRILACESIQVRQSPEKRVARAGSGPAWTPAWRWEEDTENLYAAFVEQLFAAPPSDGETWPNLQTLTRDRDRNLLYDYRTPGEDAQLELEPDCADLPYLLRAYFAWKLRLPFGYRSCTRGARDGPPVCEEALFTNLDLIEALDEIVVANAFFRRVAGTVHSASARTLPEAEWTDVYPVQLTRRALKPGTVFADPYGHLLVVAKWQPQTVDGYGVMLGADAQPDGTVGRRRFWRGSFLFSPETELVGAGFKAWRPLQFDRDQGTLVAIENRSLRFANRGSRWSLDQYKGSADRFYNRMEELINPRPLDPVRMQVRLVDALEEVVARRVVSVDNGEAFVTGRRGAAIDMPKGYRIFETIGAWEDYATPSRDMRLLISMDAVLGFGARVQDAPEQYGLSPGEADKAVSQVRAALDVELKRRTFSYTRSNGTAQLLSLQDVVTRARDFEMAYNPNDCIEIRWAAPEDSSERVTCNRRAPAAQQARMRKYRSWFADRKRPPR